MFPLKASVPRDFGIGRYGRVTDLSHQDIQKISDVYNCQQLYEPAHHAEQRLIKELKQQIRYQQYILSEQERLRKQLVQYQSSFQKEGRHQPNRYPVRNRELDDRKQHREQDNVKFHKKQATSSEISTFVRNYNHLQQLRQQFGDYERKLEANGSTQQHGRNSNEISVLLNEVNLNYAMLVF